MPSPEQLRAFADAGGLVLFMAFILGALVGLWRGLWVPGFIALRDQKRADAAEAEVRELLVTVARLTAELRSARGALRDRPGGTRERP